MEEELMRSMRFRQANNTNTNMSSIPQPVSQPMPMRTTIFGGNDAKRMSFDGNMAQYGVSPNSFLSQSPTSWRITGGLTGGVPAYNRDRRDSLKNMVHLQDFGTD